MRLVWVLVAALGLAPSALAQSTGHASGGPDAVAFVSQMVIDSKATEVSGVVVVAKPKAVLLSGVEVVDRVRCLPPRTPPDETVPAPKLVSSYPTAGQTVKPGYIVLRLTFDLPMACRGSIGVNWAGGACASQAREIWHQSYDRRSLLILCKVKPNALFVVGMNLGSLEHFVGLSGQEPHASHLFAFGTSGGPPVMTVSGLIDRDPKLEATIKARLPDR